MNHNWWRASPTCLHWKCLGKKDIASSSFFQHAQCYHFQILKRKYWKITTILWQLCAAMMSWIGCLLKDSELFILFAKNSQILLKNSIIPILLTFIYLNRWSLGDFTKMEETQMEMFNFLWLIWDHYLPLTPTKNDWPPWHPQGGVQIYPKGKFTKVSFFLQCSKMQIIPLKNFNIQTCFIQFLWFFGLKCWFKGQMISRIHLSLPNAYKLMCLIEISMEIGMLKILSGIIGHCTEGRISL